MPKYFIKTFGCQMNFSDSERLASFLKKNKFKTASQINEADLVIFNSCGVRKMAEDRALGQIHNLRKNNPLIKIALTGCISHRKDIQKILKTKVDLFFPINDFGLLKNFILKNFQNSKFKIQNSPSNQEKIAYLSINPRYTNKFQACVPIMTGCNNFCSYCVVPYARGRETSRPAEEIINEIKKLIRKGYREITLLGQNVNSYKGIFNKKEINFSQLLKMINKIPGKFWIRFMSPHPKDINDALIETITKSQKVCELIHLPLQSGSDEVLKNMNRHYTRKHYLGLIKKIKSGFKKNKPAKLFAISSDIIVGFPGENQKQFRETADIMKKAKYDMVYFGQFSRRPETVAWKMKDNVSKKEKERREKYLNKILAQTALANNKKYLNKNLEILVDHQKEKNYFGKTRTLKNVMFKSNKKNLIGNFVKVKIIKVTPWNLEGKMR
ncbi:MAG: tRNA (N6-isopentenyl adenosine(37)-C2)-methylthiotransferase MiaB [Candidatus Moraniibacteriota bacterium]